MKLKSIVIVLLVAFVLASCVPIYTFAPTKNIISTTTLTPIPAVLTNTLVFYPTPHRPQTYPLPPQKPVLFSYTILPDGGNEIYGCLYGEKQPIFVLYSDGELIALKNGQYWRTRLSQDEIDLFVEEILNTGLFKVKLDWMQQGTFSQIRFQGKEFYPPINDYSESVFKKTVDIISQYHSESFQPYVPENITLWVFKLDKIESYAADLPTPIPPIKNWDKELMPLSEYDGYYIVTGKTTPKVMAQFDKFPDYQIFSDGVFLYLTAICANISNEYYP